MKKLFIILGGLLAVVIVVFIVVAFSLGSVIKAAVNKVGPQLTQSKVELANASISPFSGEGTLTGLTIGNPAGWQSERAFFLGKIAVAVDTGSLKQDHIVITSIEIDGAEITYEAKSLTESNLRHLERNINQAIGASPEKKPEEPASKDGKEAKIEIKRLRFTNAKVNLMGFGLSGSTTIPSISMDDLGTKEGGLTPAQLSKEILLRITGQVVEAATKSAPAEKILDRAKKELERVPAGLDKLLGGEKR